MDDKQKALIWAFIIIVAALFGSVMGMSGGASMAMVSGLTGAAYASIIGKKGRGCKRGCA